MKKISTLLIVICLQTKIFSQLNIISVGSGNWTDVSTWSPGFVPGISDNVVISSGNTVTINGSSFCNNVTINSGAVLKSDSAMVLNVAGGWNNNGTYNCGKGKVLLSGNNQQTIGGSNTTKFYELEINNNTGVTLSASQEIKYLLSITAGTLTTTGFQLTFLSDNQGTASLGSMSGNANITGNITMQRYVSSSVTGWRFLGSPVKTTLQSWNDDFWTSGYPGSTYPSYYWCSVYSYDETALGTSEYGYTMPNSAGDTLYPGAGYWCWIGPTPTVIDVTGPPAKFTHTFNLSLTPSAGKYQDGWNMIANPYPSAIDWDSPNWTKSGIQNAIYIWDPQLEQYSAYINGEGVNGGSNIIPSSQAFWVEANQSNPFLSCNESVKTNQNNTFQKVSNNKIPVKLILSGNGYKDETVVCLSPNSSEAVLTSEDAVKLFSDNPVVPSITSVADSTQLVINTIPFETGETTVPVKVKVGVSGTYTITRNQALSIPDNLCIVLQDLLTNSVTDLRTLSSYTFNANVNETEPRFILKISQPVSKETSPVSCSYLSNGKAIVRYNASGNWQATWKNENDSVIAVRSKNSNADTLSGLVAGNYFITINDPGATCPSLEETLTVSGVNSISVSYAVNNNQCPGDKNGKIDASVTGGSAPYSYHWSNDRTTSFVEDLASGNYTLEISDANGCKDTTVYVINTNSSLLADFKIENDLYNINLFEPVVFTNSSVGQTSCTWELGNTNTSEQNPVNAYSSPGTYTVTLTSFDGNCVSVAKKAITIKGAATGNMHNGPGGIHVYGSDDDAVVEFNLDNSTESIITVYDASGKLVQSLKTFSQNNREILNLGASHGIYIVRVQTPELTYQSKIIK